jgi:hypothetical protein
MKGRKMDKIRLKKRIHKKEKGGNNCWVGTRLLTELSEYCSELFGGGEG